MTENASWNHASCYLKFFNQLAASMNAYPDTEKPNSSLNSFLIHSKISQIYSRSKLNNRMLWHMEFVMRSQEWEDSSFELFFWKIK